MSHPASPGALQDNSDPNYGPDDQDNNLYLDWRDDEESLLNNKYKVSSTLLPNQAFEAWHKQK